MEQKWKRPLALLLSVAMMFSMSGTPVYAADMETGASAVCPHHVHDETCGYSEGTPCTHEHTDDCYSLVTQCVHEHTAECYSDGMLPAEGEEKAADACTHVCSEESGCITKELNCPHVHDETCGYSEGSPCTFDPSDCELCNPTDSGEPEAPAECICETLCTADSVNPDCPVCGAEGADLAACAGTVEEGDAAEETDPAQNPAEQTILSWEWIGADNLNEGVLALPDVSAENPVDLATVVSMLPTGITATVDGSADPVELALTWSCGDFPETASAGEYTFTAALPEGYTLGEETAAPTVAVVLGGAQTLAITPVRPTGGGTEQNPYQIGTAAELLWFGQQVADRYYSIWATLTADINMEGEIWPNLMRYSGTFDGAGHTISNLTIPQGFVAQLAGGTIKNLTLDATCRVTGDGSICGSLSENGTIQNCTNKADVTNSGRIIYTGGICGQIYDTTGTIENCINLGNVTGSRIAGGICGQQMAGTIQNCSNIGTVATTSESGGEAGGICGRLSDGSIFNCHWLSSSCGSAIGYTAPAITITTDGLYSWREEEFASGKVCFLLNKSSSGEGTVWRQNLDNGQTSDPYPVLDSTHSIVYINGANYTNTKPKHTFDEDGFCTEPGCSYYQPAVEVNGVYQIYNNGQLLWFAAFINKDAAHAQYETSDPSADAMLMNDLALNHTIDGAATWVPIGNRDISYCGTFDGNGKTISNLVNNGESYQGFVGRLGDGGVIQNLTLDATCSVKSSGYSSNYLGGICGRQSGGTIQNCANYAEVSGRDLVGGICGSQEGNSTIKFCYNASVDIYGSTGATGGICGSQGDNSTIEFCYNSGKVDGDGPYEGAISGWLRSGCTIRNCYWLQGSCSTGYFDKGGTAEKVEQKTAEEFASGAVAWLLNGSTSEGDLTWHQNLDNGQTVDAFPVLDSSHGTVYHGSWHCGSVTKAYANNPDFQSQDEHSFDESAICTNCGVYQPAEAQNGVYQIKNVGNLFWFAALVNGNTNQEGITQAVPTANAVLTADIDLGGREWAPIAPSTTFRSNATSVARTTDKSYSGTFDGQGHTISNFEIRTNRAELTSGLFGAVTGTIENLGIVNASFDNGGDYDGRFGALCGLLAKDDDIETAATIQNCYVVDSSIEATGKIAGAVCGANYGGTIKDCYECGNTVTAHNRIGHLVGDNQNDYTSASWLTLRGTVTNCYSDTKLAGTQGGTVNGGGVKDAEAFASGAVCFLLNNSTSGGDLTWYQNLDNGQTVDTYPVLDSSHGIVYCIEEDPVRYSNDPNGKPAQISVDITWGELSFTYSDGTWNPDTHEYDGEGWTVDEEGGNSIKVENTGNTDVNVTYEYKAEETGITGSFTDGEPPVSAPVSLPANNSSTVYLILAGKPENELMEATIGSVTVTIGGESE